MLSSSIPTTPTMSAETRRLKRKWEIAADDLNEVFVQLRESKEIERSGWAEYQNSVRLDLERHNEKNEKEDGTVGQGQSSSAGTVASTAGQGTAASSPGTVDGWPHRSSAGQ